jgi:hypothetical protein
VGTEELPQLCLEESDSSTLFFFIPTSLSNRRLPATPFFSELA